MKTDTLSVGDQRPEASGRVAGNINLPTPNRIEPRCSDSLPVVAHYRKSGKYHARAFRTRTEAVSFLLDNVDASLTAIRLEVRISAEDRGNMPWSVALDHALR